MISSISALHTHTHTPSRTLLFHTKLSTPALHTLDDRDNSPEHSHAQTLLHTHTLFYMMLSTPALHTLDIGDASFAHSHAHTLSQIHSLIHILSFAYILVVPPALAGEDDVQLSSPLHIHTLFLAPRHIHTHTHTHTHTHDLELVHHAHSHIYTLSHTFSLSHTLWCTGHENDLVSMSTANTHTLYLYHTHYLYWCTSND